MNEILERLKRIGVHNLRNNHEVMLEIHHDKMSHTAEIDTHLNELLNELKNSELQKVRLECPQTMLDRLNKIKKRMKIVGERVIYTRPFPEPMDISVSDYEIWPTRNPKAISLLSAVMARSFNDAEKFLINMEAELPLQADKMYTVYFVRSEPAGLVFPHIEPDSNKEGRIFWIGIHPKYLGQGLGKNLHLIGLNRLQEDFGAKSYLGATQVDNVPMRKIMISNGCVQNKHHVVSVEFKVAATGF
ncbi:N-acetyltransferase [Jeotgalibacillus sp. S-D1]|uniref:GNAT family N-acetyltransferase n=1 Tax=Jeotgalibacillus sp. S-D1 TaxID=2552189 RepID=UPI001059CD9E|nr:GNAT family N-acetyltransferase [Jeotgalibacillus sp. S-D1]TDL35358.1 N-acetyltransferase [Jeotgalibacillus sp. S-D1]